MEFKSGSMLHNLTQSYTTMYSRLGSLALARQPVYEKENFEFKPALLHLKIDFVPHPA